MVYFKKVYVYRKQNRQNVSMIISVWGFNCCGSCGRGLYIEEKSSKHFDVNMGFNG